MHPISRVAACNRAFFFAFRPCWTAATVHASILTSCPPHGSTTTRVCVFWCADYSKMVLGARTRPFRSKILTCAAGHFADGDARLVQQPDLRVDSHHFGLRCARHLQPRTHDRGLTRPTRCRAQTTVSKPVRNPPTRSSHKEMNTRSNHLLASPCSQIIPNGASRLHHRA